MILVIIQLDNSPREVHNNNNKLFSFSKQLLERSLKMFIKTACCFPERITKKDYDSILTELKDSEKVSLILFALSSHPI